MDGTEATEFYGRDIVLGRGVDVRLEHFGSVIYRRKLFDFAELDHFGTLVCYLIKNGHKDLDDLIGTLAGAYGQPYDLVSYDLIDFLKDMIGRGFIVLDPVDGEPSKRIRFDSAVEHLEKTWSLIPEANHYSAPLQFHWEITHECNLRCMHCYATASANLKDEVDTLNWDYCTEVLRTLRDMNVIQINFLGGEPLIEKRFFDLLDLTYEYGIDISFPTNGVLLDRERLEHLKRLGMEYVTVSLDCADPETFERLRGVRDIHAKVVENIILARELGFNVIVNAVVTKMNWQEFETLIEFLLLLDVSILKVIDEFPVGRGLKNIEDLMLTPKEYREFYRIMLEEVEPRYSDRMEIRLNPRFTLTREGVMTGEVKDDGLDYRCSAGRSQCFCTADGDIYPCYLFYGEKDFAAGNLHQRSFREIWHDVDSFTCFREKMGNVDECLKCEFASVCKGGCRGEAYKFTGDFFAGNPYCWNLNTGD